MPCYIYFIIQKVRQKWKTLRLSQFYLQRKQADATSGELQIMLEEFKKLPQEKDAQVSATAHVCIGSAYDTPLESGTENSEVHCLLC